MAKIDEQNVVLISLEREKYEIEDENSMLKRRNKKILIGLKRQKLKSDSLICTNARVNL